MTCNLATFVLRCRIIWPLDLKLPKSSLLCTLLKETAAGRIVDSGLGPIRVGGRGSKCSPSLAAIARLADKVGASDRLLETPERRVRPATETAQRKSLAPSLAVAHASLPSQNEFVFVHLVCLRTSSHSRPNRKIAIVRAAGGQL